MSYLFNLSIFSQLLLINQLNSCTTKIKIINFNNQHQNILNFIIRIKYKHNILLFKMYDLSKIYHY